MTDEPTIDLFGEERAVSPVIGVILMVAITVILAAVIGTFVLDLGQNVESNPEAAVTFSEDSSNNVNVRVDNVQRADSMSVDATDCGGSESSITAEAGATESVTCSSDGEVVVTATYDGNTAVIQTYEFET